MFRFFEIFKARHFSQGTPTIFVKILDSGRKIRYWQTVWTEDGLSLFNLGKNQAHLQIEEEELIGWERVVIQRKRTELLKQVPVETGPAFCIVLSGGPPSLGLHRVGHD